MTIEQQLESHHRQAYLWARQCCTFNGDWAQEVLQDAYLKILEGKAVFRGKSSFKTWLFSIIRFTAIDALKKNSRTIHLSDSFVLEASETSSGENEVFEKMIEQLPPKQSELLLLVFYHNMTIEAAAHVMEISAGTARTHYDRGKKNLKEQILRSGLRDAISMSFS